MSLSSYLKMAIEVTVMDRENSPELGQQQQYGLMIEEALWEKAKQQARKEGLKMGQWLTNAIHESKETIRESNKCFRGCAE